MAESYPQSNDATEELGFVPYDPSNVHSEIERRKFEIELLLEDGYGRPSATLRPVDHDGDNVAETTELVLTDQLVWDLYRKDILMPGREAFLTETTSGQVISRHMAVATYISRWVDWVYGRKRLVPFGGDESQGISSQAATAWAIRHLGVDMDNARRASAFIHDDDGARTVVEHLATEIETAQRGLAALTLVLMTVPELQIRHAGQSLAVDEEGNADWKVGSIMGDGSLIIERQGEASEKVSQQRVTVAQLLQWNNLNFVPGQASRVRPPDAS